MIEYSRPYKTDSAPSDLVGQWFELNDEHGWCWSSIELKFSCSNIFLKFKQDFDL